MEVGCKTPGRRPPATKVATLRNSPCNRSCSRIRFSAPGRTHSCAATVPVFDFRDRARPAHGGAHHSAGCKGYFKWTAETIAAERMRHEDLLRTILRLLSGELPQIESEDGGSTKRWNTQAKRSLRSAWRSAWKTEDCCPTSESALRAKQLRSNQDRNCRAAA
jgi:hypothetical protein